MSTGRKPRLVHGTQRTIARMIGVRPATLSKVFAERQALGIERAALCSAREPARDSQMVEAAAAARDAWLLRELGLFDDLGARVVAVARLRAGAESSAVLGTGTSR